MNDERDICGWVKLWHPQGVQVTLPVPMPPREWDAGGKVMLMEVHQSKAMLDWVSAALSAGWLPREVGLEAGEMKEEVGWVSRATTTGRTGQADVIAFYSTNESWTKPFLTDYLNTEADRQEFQAATGINPASIPEYIGEGRLERGKNPKTDALIVRLPRAVSLVMKPNPKYNEAEAASTKAAQKVYKVPKKVFVRWDGAAQSVTAPEQNHDPANGSITQGQVQLLDDLMRENAKLGGKVKPEAVLKWLGVADWFDLDQAGFAMCRDYLNDLIAKRKAVVQ